MQKTVVKVIEDVNEAVPAADEPMEKDEVNGDSLKINVNFTKCIRQDFHACNM